jgi:hypothetical protein
MGEGAPVGGGWGGQGPDVGLTLRSQSGAARVHPTPPAAHAVITWGEAFNEGQLVQHAAPAAGHCLRTGCGQGKEGAREWPGQQGRGGKLGFGSTRPGTAAPRIIRRADCCLAAETRGTNGACPGRGGCWGAERARGRAGCSSAWCHLVRHQRGRQPRVGLQRAQQLHARGLADAGELPSAGAGRAEAVQLLLHQR